MDDHLDVVDSSFDDLFDLVDESESLVVVLVDEALEVAAPRRRLRP